MHSELSRAKHPRTILAGPYGHPFHPIAVIVPIGAWISAVVFDVIALNVEDPTVYAIGARILIIIGLIGAAVAAVLGVLDWLNIPKGTTARRTGTTHMVLNLLVMGMFALSLAVRPGDEVPVLAVALSVGGVAVLSLSGWLGGKLSHTYGVRVADERTQAEGFESTP